MKKKSGIISLESYRQKKQRSKLKNEPQAVGGEKSFYSGNKDSSIKKGADKAGEEAKIYYMANYLKKKKIEPLAEEKKSPPAKRNQKKEGRTEAKIIHFPWRRKTRRNSAFQSKASDSSEPISLEKYRQAKRRREKIKKSLSYASKKALPLTAVALAALFAVAIFFQKEGGVNMAEKSLESGAAKRQLASPQNGKIPEDQRFIRGKRPKSTDYIGY